MHDAFTGSEPLNITTCVSAAKARRGPERIGMVDQTLAHDGDGLEAAMRVRREARNLLPVVQRPAVLAFKILPQIATCQRCIGPQVRVAARVGIVVVNAKQKGVYRWPGWRTELRNTQNGFIVHDFHLKMTKYEYFNAITRGLYSFIAILLIVFRRPCNRRLC